eukprot:642130-Pyramimonas_sp.AAC.1
MARGWIGGMRTRMTSSSRRRRRRRKRRRRQEEPWLTTAACVYSQRALIFGATRSGDRKLA